MQVQIHITLTDKLNDGDLVASGFSRKKLLEFYTEAFKGILANIDESEMQVELLVAVNGRTKEEANDGI